jgi:hypothetical protein
MWNGLRARHRQDACATSFTSEMKTQHIRNPIYTKPNIYETQHIPGWVSLRSTQPTKKLYQLILSAEPYSFSCPIS